MSAVRSKHFSDERVKIAVLGGSSAFTPLLSKALARAASVLPSLDITLFGRNFHVRPMAPFFLPLDIFLHLARVGTLSIRLLANMFADHMVVAVWITMVPLAIPAIFMALGLLVAVLQAFVFSLLTMIYIGLALEDPH